MLVIEPAVAITGRERICLLSLTHTSIQGVRKQGATVRMGPGRKCPGAGDSARVERPEGLNR